MKKTMSGIMAAALLFFMSGSIQSTAYGQQPPENLGRDDKVINELFTLTNERRVNPATREPIPEGVPADPGSVPALILDEKLSFSAQVHAKNMGDLDFFEHQGKDGSGTDSRAAAAGWKGRGVGENIAKGYPTPAWAIKGWMTSTKGHRGNLLRESATHVGLGAYVAANGTHYWVMVLGTKKVGNNGAMPPSKGEFLINQLSKKCLEVAGDPGTANGANVQLWDCEFSKPNTDQKWQINSEGFIINTLSKKCLDVAGAPGTANGTNVALYDCEFSNPGTDQKWEINSQGFIINKLSKKCLDVAGPSGTANGTSVELYDCEFSNPTTDQKWAWQLK